MGGECVEETNMRLPGQMAVPEGYLCQEVLCPRVWSAGVSFDLNTDLGAKVFVHSLALLTPD